MKKIVRLFVVVFFLLGITSDFVHSALNNRTVLEPNSEIGRTCRILSNTIMIRFKKGNSPKSLIENKKRIFGMDAEISESFLKPSESYTFNIRKQPKATIQTQKVINKIIEAEEYLLRTYIVEYSSNISPEKYCELLLKRISEIEIAEPYYIPKLLEYYINDPIADSQTMLQTIQMYDAWEIEEGDSNVIIGISDIGVHQYHPDLYNSIAPNWADPNNGIDDDGNGYIDDFLGYDMSGDNEPPGLTFHSNAHGTNVAGIAAATVNNGIGMAGIANKCRFFPIKIAPNNSNVLIYSYQSIKYAALRGVKVLNCSWGIENKPFSEIEQSIINFAVARDVAIVASGGNFDGSFSKNYPAAYHNVLGVGEVDQSDIFAQGNFGEFIDLLAPGGGNWHTDNNNEYSNTGLGTSYSAPVVAGVVALIRAKYPELSALQSLEHARLSVDDISELTGNEIYKDLLPGRINALKAITIEPFSRPSIRPEKINYTDNNGVKAERFMTGDTVNISIEAHNYLGAANNIKLVLSAFWDKESISVLDSIVQIPYVERESDLTIETFKIKANIYNPDLVFLRVDIYRDGVYYDFFLIPYVPDPIITTFENDAVKFSVSDRGTIGFGGKKGNKQGFGFVFKGYDNQIWKSAFFATEFMGNVVNSVEWDMSDFQDYNDFRTIKPFVSPDRNIGVFDDSEASGGHIGIEVKEEFIVPKGNYPIIKLNLEIKNITDNRLIDFSSGYFFDWDLSDSDSNIVSLINWSIPDTLVGFPAAIEMIEYSGGNYPVCGSAVIAYELGAEAQAAGLSSDVHSIYLDDTQIDMMNSGTSIQDLGIMDASIFVGMKFPGEFNSNEIKKYSICFGCAENKDELVASFIKAMSRGFTPVEKNDIVIFDFKVYPQPASNQVKISLANDKSAEILISFLDVFGRELLSKDDYLQANILYNHSFNLNSFASGQYYIRLNINNRIVVKPLLIIR